MPDEPQKASNMYPKWVGVLLSILLTGAGQFLAGRRRVGIKWFCFFYMGGVIFCVILSTPSNIATRVAWSIFLIGSLAWVVMLKDSYARIPRFGLLKWLVIFLVVVVLYVGQKISIRLLVWPFSVASEAMAPSLRGPSKTRDGKLTEKDYVLVRSFAYWFEMPRRGDIVVFRTRNLDMPMVTKGQYYVKRIVGLPGETIRIRDGKIFINGSPQLQSPFDKIHYVPANAISRAAGSYLLTEEDTYIVPDGSYFILGDNSLQSRDSRFFGPVRGDDIVGKVTKIYWPWDRVGVPQ